MNQPRLSRCRRCGELNGQALVDDPFQGPTLLPVNCICKGIGCHRCGMRMIRRPISNRFEETTGSVMHMPWFGWLIPCERCAEQGAV